MLQQDQSNLIELQFYAPLDTGNFG